MQYLFSRCNVLRTYVFICGCICGGRKTYMHHETRVSLVLIVAGRLLIDKPFSDLVLTYCCVLLNTVSYDNMMTSSNGNIFRVTGHLCGEFTGPRWIPHTRPVTRSFDVFFDLRLNNRLSKQWWGWWFETLSRSLWRHRNVIMCDIKTRLDKTL